ncbi:MAG: extracellular solute-binding protein [Flavitalea sp.]
MEKTILRGITWAHSRGITPLLASSQRFNELHPNIDIRWEKRTLQDFADFPLEALAEKFDLLIIDHPWVGTAAKKECILPLDNYLPSAFLKEQREQSVGSSYTSYEYADHLWALAIDAAAPAASFRADLFHRANRTPPANWEELINLAKEGKVAIPGIPVDTILHFLMFCLATGEEPFQNKRQAISLEKGKLALQCMHELWSLCDKEIFGLNPIALAEKMSSSDKYWYCPFAFCYSNYSREGFAEKQLTYTDLLRFTPETKLRSVLGGTGLAISAVATNRDACLEFAQWITSPVIQRTIYGEHGGQPGHRSAWTSPRLNTLTDNYFINALPAVSNAYVRPRYHGFLYFQDHAGEMIWRYLLNGGNETVVIEQLNALYVESLTVV